MPSIEQNENFIYHATVQNTVIYSTFPKLTSSCQHQLKHEFDLSIQGKAVMRSPWGTANMVPIKGVQY